ncbi:hypothetical protein H6P81_008121 [Aristolochia fimbriata]|uniref:Uncharacterized protein n=1 Tax=Aristolochia fimbriata TaxID=158543 RepID=A0AAV7F5E8_ARIFI|nr:hypothetical protein H6P81_008121 [Aristolochia fimbriata]
MDTCMAERKLVELVMGGLTHPAFFLSLRFGSVGGGSLRLRSLRDPIYPSVNKPCCRLGILTAVSSETWK